MRFASKMIPAFIVLIFVGTQCSKNITEPDQEVQEDAYYTESLQLSDEIDNLEELALLDSPENIEQHLRKALYKLDRLLDKVGFILRRHENEAARVLYEEARGAQQNARDAAQAGNYEEAFDYVKESRYFAVEALKLIKEDIQEHREEIAQRLEEGIEAVGTLLEEIETALPNLEDERVEKIYNKASRHLEAAKKALEEGRLIRSGFHLREAHKLARIALRIIDGSG